MGRMVATVVCGLALMMAGCGLFTSKETAYLRSAENHATQEEVRTQLGAPRTAAMLPDGESLWVYEIRDLEPMSQSSWSTLGSWCDEYRLTFDRSGILRPPSIAVTARYSPTCP